MDCDSITGYTAIRLLLSLSASWPYERVYTFFFEYKKINNNHSFTHILLSLLASGLTFCIFTFGSVYSENIKIPGLL